MDEFEKYRKGDGSIDWGAYYADKTEQGLGADSPKKIVELEDLRAFQMADELSDYVWEIVAKWDFFAKKTVGDQYVRAADSIGANIAEGLKANCLAFNGFCRPSYVEAVKQNPGNR